jgi:hypothetical protein
MIDNHPPHSADAKKIDGLTLKPSTDLTPRLSIFPNNGKNSLKADGMKLAIRRWDA